MKSILSNEKYIGDVLLQNVYFDSHLTKRCVKSSGEVQQYYVTGDCEAIIEPKMKFFGKDIRYVQEPAKKNQVLN